MFGDESDLFRIESLPGVVSVEVYRDGDFLGSTTGDLYIDLTHPEKEWHQYKCIAKTADGKEYAGAYESKRHSEYEADAFYVP